MTLSANWVTVDPMFAWGLRVIARHTRDGAVCCLSGEVSVIFGHRSFTASHHEFGTDCAAAAGASGQGALSGDSGARPLL